MQIPAVMPGERAGDIGGDGVGLVQDDGVIGHDQFAAQFFQQKLVAQLLAPQLSGLVQILGIGRVPAVGGQPVIAGKFEFILFQQFVHIRVMLLEAFKEALVDFKGRCEIGGLVTAQRVLVEIGPVMGKFVNIRLQQIFLVRIQRLEIAVKKLFGHLRVQRLL